MSDALLEVDGLDAYYGSAHVLEGVSFTMGDEPVAVIGRNGMGKTTLCNAIMGIVLAECARVGPLPRARSCSAGPRTRSRRRHRLRAAGPAAASSR